MKLASLAVRLFAILLVLVSPWLAPRTRASHDRAVVYVVDRSDSIGEHGRTAANELVGAAWARGAGAKLGVVAFDGAAELVTPVGGPKPAPIGKGKQGDASDLAAALRLARAALPTEGHRSIVVLSDARPTRGDTLAEVRAAADAGIRVDFVAIEGETPALPLIVSIRPRANHVAEHQPVALDVEVRATEPFVLTWTRDGIPMRPHREMFHDPYAYRDDPGSDPPAPRTKQVALLDAEAPSGPHVYEVKATGFRAMYKHFAGVAPAPDPAPESAPVLASVSVEGKARATVFSSTGDVPPMLKKLLEDAGLQAQSLPMDRAADPSLWSGSDLLVLADARLSASATDEAGLTRAGQTALVDWVQQGGGLLVTGGVFGLAPEWASAPLAKALPVEIEDRGHVEDPPVSLAVMLDRSGSMGMPVGNHTKIELALEASLAAADVLRASDQIAIASVDTQSNWDVPLGPVSRMPEYRDKVRAVTAGGGGIYVYTALKDAYRELAAVKTPIRHVILFSDTSDSEEQIEEHCNDNGCSQGRTAESLAREARGKGITTTVVGIGDEAASDTPFLRSLAAAAGGRFYLTSEGADLRRIFLSETRVLAQDNLRERKAQVAAAGPHPVLQGLDPRKLPPVSAFVETRRRPGADDALVLADTPEQRPLLSTWRYGLGKVGTIATDLESGLGDGWAQSPVGAQALQQTLRFLVRQSDAHKADATVTMRGRSVDVAIDLAPDVADRMAAEAAPRTIELFAVAKSGTSRKLEGVLELAGPGHWVAHARTLGEPIVVARVRDGRGGLVAEAVGREDRVFETTGEGVDEQLGDEIARIGGGRVGPTPEATLDVTARPARALVATWPYALVAAAALVVLDLVLRRFGTRRASRPLQLTRRAGAAPHHASI